MHVSVVPLITVVLPRFCKRYAAQESIALRECPLVCRVLQGIRAILIQAGMAKLHALQDITL